MFPSLRLNTPPLCADCFSLETHIAYIMRSVVVSRRTLPPLARNAQCKLMPYFSDFHSFWSPGGMYTRLSTFSFFTTIVIINKKKESTIYKFHLIYPRLIDSFYIALFSTTIIYNSRNSFFQQHSVVCFCRYFFSLIV